MLQAKQVLYICVCKAYSRKSKGGYRSGGMCRSECGGGLSLMAV